MPNKGLRFVDIQEHSDARGKMRIVEVDGGGLPFVPVRSFIVSDVPSGKSRAGHAVSCDELIIVAQGSCLITARTAAGLEEHRLTPDTGAAHLRPGTWLMLSDCPSSRRPRVIAKSRARAFCSFCNDRDQLSCFLSPSDTCRLICRPTIRTLLIPGSKA